MENPAADRLSLGDPSLPGLYTTWRHCKGDLYKVAGHSLDPDGAVHVLYIKAHIKPDEPVQIYNQAADRFLGIHPGLNRARFEEVS